jgi:hypothetical protein
MYTRSAERSSASLKGTAEPLLDPIAGRTEGPDDGFAVK